MIRHLSTSARILDSQEINKMSDQIYGTLLFPCRKAEARQVILEKLKSDGWRGHRIKTGGIIGGWHARYGNLHAGNARS